MANPSPATGVQLPVLLRFLDHAADALARAREEIDALNVYPVPDGDTGTNMYLTVAAAREAAAELAGGELEEAAPNPDPTPAAHVAKGALLAARGNSGVILSQMLGALLERIDRTTGDERYATVMAEAMHAATEASYRAVGHPVEGTILTVARAASEAALAAAGESEARTRDVAIAAARSAREALARTPEQLQVLADAGVVDAGGRGLTVILDSLEAVLTGRRSPGRETWAETAPIPAPAPPPPPTHAHADPDDGEYEVMYLLDAEDDAVGELRTTLDTLGDSLVIVGGDGLWNVHVHTGDAGAAVEAGMAAGRPHRVRITHLDSDVDRTARPPRPAPDVRRVVAVTAGPGLAELFTEAGATVVEGGPGRRPSTGMLLEAIASAGAGEVVVLPNDPDSVRAAELAARTAETDHGVRVSVIPTRAQVQGLAALAVHDPARGFEADVLEMTATARHVLRGAVTVAAKKAITTAGACEVGDALGVLGGDFAIVGNDLEPVALEVLERLLGGGGELVTLVSGADDADGALAGRCRDWLAEVHPTVEVVAYDGGQQRYPLLVSVE